MGGKWPRNVILTKISVACDHGWGVSTLELLSLLEQFLAPTKTLAFEVKAKTTAPLKQHLESSSRQK